VGVWSQLAQSLAPPERLLEQSPGCLSESRGLGSAPLGFIALLVWGRLKAACRRLLFRWVCRCRRSRSLAQRPALLAVLGRLQTRLYEPTPLVTRHNRTEAFRVLNWTSIPERPDGFDIAQVLGLSSASCGTMTSCWVAGRAQAQAADILLSSTRPGIMLAARSRGDFDTVQIPGYHKVLARSTMQPEPGATCMRPTPRHRMFGSFRAGEAPGGFARASDVADPRMPDTITWFCFPPSAPINSRPLRGLPPPSSSTVR